MRKCVIGTLILFAAATLPGTAGAREDVPKKLSDAEISKILIGKWADEIDEEGIKGKGTCHYKKDGTFEAEGTFEAGEKSLKMTVFGTWKVSEGVLTSTVTKTSVPKMVKEGHVSKDRVLSIDEKEFRFKMRDGKEVVQKRITAQDEKVMAVVKTEAKKLVEATIDGKYEVIVAQTHPKLVEELGGKEKATQKLKEMMEATKARGFTFEIRKIETPTVVKSKGNYFSVVPYTLTVSGRGKKVTLKTAVVGLSADGGKTWSFVNLEGGEETVRRFLPDFPRELKIPKQVQTIEDTP